MTLCVAAVALAGVSPAEAAQPTQQALDRSIKSPPIIRDLRMRQASKGRVLVRFNVKYPRIGTKPEKALVKLRVWKSKTRQHFFVERRSRAPIPSKRTLQYTFLIRGKAATVLRRAGVGKHWRSTNASKKRRRPEHYVSVVAQHARNIDSDRALDHTRSRSASGKALQDPEPNLQGAEGTLTMQNITGGTVVTSAGPAICMYDDGDGKNSHISDLNSTALASGYANTVDIQSDAQLAHSIVDHRGIGGSSQKAAGVFNAEGRQFGFEMNVHYSRENRLEPNSNRQAQTPRSTT